MSNDRVKSRHLKMLASIGVLSLMGSACSVPDGEPDSESVLVQAAPQDISRHYYGYANPATGEVRFSDTPFEIEEDASGLDGLGQLVPNQFGEVPLVQDGVNGTNPPNTFEIQGLGASLNNASQVSGQTQCPGSNFIIDIRLKHFFDFASFENVFVEFTKIEPGPTHYPYGTDSVPGGLPLDNSIGVYGYGTLSDGNSNQADRTWKFERCTAEPFIFEFDILGSCVPEAGKTAIEACFDNPGYKRLMAANGTSCFRDLNGAKCWGNNSDAQLTTDNFDNSATPVPIKKEIKNKFYFVDSADGGEGHSCALMSDRTVRCWGDNSNGQLGDGTLNSSALGVTVELASGGSLTSIIQVAAGSDHSCALTSSKNVLCWGKNSLGQLGTNNTVASRSPVQVLAPTGPGSLSNVTQIAVNDSTTCALLASEEVVCWGINRQGQVGDGSLSDARRPAYVQFGGANLSQVTHIAAGGLHTCARTSTGNVKCWGDNKFLQLGDGTNVDRVTAIDVLGAGGTGILSNVANITAGKLHTCALMTNGEVQCWGNGARLGRGSSSSSSIPVSVRNASNTGNLTGVTSVKAMESSTCALDNAGNVTCWGLNSAGQLGSGTTATQLLPVAVKNTFGSSQLENIKKIFVGVEFGCAISTSNNVLCWGDNANGQLATGTFVSSTIPVETTLEPTTLKSPLLGITSMVNGNTHSCALLNTGGVQCWGSNGNGQLGTGDEDEQLYPVDVVGPNNVGLLSGVVQLVANGNTTCALLDTEEVVCWGFNRKGQLGNNTISESAFPVFVQLGAGNLQDVVQISAGLFHACATTSFGEAYCWGFNKFGQLGDGTTTDRRLPTNVKGPGGVGFLNNVASMHAGEDYSCALLVSGEVYCWGRSGRLGRGVTGSSSVPVAVRGVGGVGTLTNVVGLSIYSTHTLALIDDGTLVGWGSNTTGQLGDGTTTLRLSPVRVLNDTGTFDLLGVREIAAGVSHSCAYMANRSVMCWGAGDEGQLGDGSFTNSSLPVTVTGL